MYQIWYIAKGIGLKDVFYNAATLKVISGFPEETFLSLDELIQKLRQGHVVTMPSSRPMNIVMPGVSELRLKDRHGVYRIFYYMKLSDRLLIFHAFQKKDQKTPVEKIETARSRLKKMLRELAV